MQYAREAEDAQRKFEALMADLKKKFDGLLEENIRSYNQQSLAIHQTHVKVHRSRLLAEALRTRGMFDVAYQHRATGTYHQHYYMVSPIRWCANHRLFKKFSGF